MGEAKRQLLPNERKVFAKFETNLIKTCVQESQFCGSESDV